MIKEKLANAIKTLSEKYNVESNEFRIKILRNNGDMKYELMRKDKTLAEVTLAKALNLDAISAFVAGNRLEGIFDTLSKKNNISQDSMNVRIYTKTSDCSPLFYLFDGTEAKKAVPYEEISEQLF